METFNENMAYFDPRNPYVGDERTPIQFYMGTIQNDGKSTQEGRPIFDDVECIKIFNSKDNIIDRPIREQDKQRWPRQYAAWKAGDQKAGDSGTRLEHWPALTRAQAEEMKYFKIFTVEQLAEYPDSQGHVIMNFHKLKSLARATLELAKGAAPIAKLQAELESRDATIAELQDAVAKLTRKVQRLNERVGTANS